MLVLALETATDVCSVALVEDDAALVSLTLRRPRQHAEQLVPLVQDALRYAGATLGDLAGIAVSQGPGSYTGLRIGVSTAKGLAAASGVPLVGVPTLEALALQAVPQAEPGDVVAAFLRSRRDEVYAAAFTVAPAPPLSPLREAAALPLPDVAAWLGTDDRRRWLVGDGAPAAAAAGALSGTLLDAAAVAPSASTVGRLGAERLRTGSADDLAAFEPAYLKDFVARAAKKSVFERLPF